MSSSDAFDFLRRVYRYDQYERRDGSIVDKVIVGDEIISDEKTVSRLLIEHLETIRKDPRWEFYEDTPPVPFPVLEPLSSDEVKEIFRRISIHKALAGDLISDVILEKEYVDRICDLFRDLWNGRELDDFHFKSRLVALNKKHPEVPRVDQFRPIIITSLLVKMLEARLVEPLRNYMSKELNVSQVGFVP